jgi:hypothetical protein
VPRTLTTAEVAAELGRSLDWLYRNWLALHEDEGMPGPIHGGQRAREPMVWSAAQLWAWLDRDLPPPMRAATAAFRIAEAAMLETLGKPTRTQAELHDWKQRLDARFAPRTGA